MIMQMEKLTVMIDDHILDEMPLTGKSTDNMSTLFDMLNKKLKNNYRFDQFVIGKNSVGESWIVMRFDKIENKEKEND